MISFFTTLELRTQLMLLIGIVFAGPLLYASLYISSFMSAEYYDEYDGRAQDIAWLAASAPLVREALLQPEKPPGRELAHYLRVLTAATRVRYIVPITMNARSLFHPDKAKAGIAFTGGDEERALRGEQYVSTTVDSLGYTRRAFVPVYDAEGRQLGAVAVGIRADAFDAGGQNEHMPLQKVMFGAMMLGLLLTVLLAQSIKNILSGLEPREIASLLKERSAMLQMVNEGVIAVNLQGRVTLVNDEAVRILHKAGIEESLQGKKLAEFIPVNGLLKTMDSGVPEFDDEQNINGVILLANHMPVAINQRPTGAISTFRDMSEVRALAERVTDINRYVDALRSQSHEFMNKLHVIMGLLNSGKTDELRIYTENLIDVKTAESKAIYTSIKDPVIAGFLSSKYSAARELGMTIRFDIRGVMPDMRDSALRNGLITILGNLIDNSLDAMQDSGEKRLWVNFALCPGELGIVVSDTGSGMDEETEECMFQKGFSTKGETRGLGLWLVRRAVHSLGGSLEVRTRPGKGSVFSITLPF